MTNNSFLRLRTAVLATGLALGFATIQLSLTPVVGAQETTGDIQGTVRDPTGALVPDAKVTVSAPTLVGTKSLTTDSKGYYHFSNLPPGLYTIAVEANGFNSLKRAGLSLEVGHSPTVDLTLQVGSSATTVEVTSEAPAIDVTSVTTQTNITSDALTYAPHGISYQSVIQFAPMARNEPLAGQAGGTGGSMPGSSGNGLGFGYSIGGAADSENSYLVEGQDTEDISAGYSKANVPMEFIQEVQVTTSGVPAEYGGALGGVINVIMKKGGNSFHGQLVASYQSSGTSANPVNEFLRYDPTDTGSDNPGVSVADPNPQIYVPQKEHFRTIEPGVTVGGPIVKNRLWFFAGFEPLVNTVARTVNFNVPDNFYGSQYFTQDRTTYFGSLRLDAALTDKIRVYASWLYQYAREAGVNLPDSDPIGAESSFLNPSVNTPIAGFSHGLGFSAPNSTYIYGADISITPRLVSTTRLGYFFQNYHDFGWQTSTPNLVFNASGVGATDNAGAPLPGNLQQPGGYSTAPYTGTFTLFNASKHYQFNQDFALYKATRFGTHNLKIGYQLNHLSNVIDQNGNVPQAFVIPGSGNGYNPLTSTGGGNCATLEAEWGVCAGQYGYLEVQDFATVLTSPAVDWNHALYAQDSWTIGKGLTIDAGLRVEKEDLPAPNGVKVNAIHFSWGDKIEPRVGAIWDPTHTGKMKFFANYGVVNDVMKLLLAQTSFGAQAFEICSYPLGPDGTPAGYNNSDIDLTFKNGRACPSGNPTSGANFASGNTPASLTDPSGVSLIENANERPFEPVVSGAKPYRQHEYVAGWAYQIGRNTTLDVRYDRRRLDHILEDASLSDTAWGEIYTVVNPGEGPNSTLDGYAAYLTSLGQDFGFPGMQFDSAAFGTCTTCPANPEAIRNYDGVEVKLSKAMTHKWAGMVAYTYSSLWGNYSGLTTTDQSDGGIAGRASPDTTRSFDEPFYYFKYNGQSNAGPLPTDRPNTVKGYIYYRVPWWKSQVTTLGLFQTIYQGSPVSSYVDLAAALQSEPYEATYLYGRGQWAPVTMDPVSGAVTLGTPYARRTPMYTQSDFNFTHEIPVGESRTIAFEATALNLLNQHAVTSYYEGINSLNFASSMNPTNPSTGGPANLYDGASLYQTLETGYDPQAAANSSGLIKSSLYGKPNLWQYSRTVRLTVRYTF